MRGVDGLNQLLSYNTYQHRTRKWYMKIFNYFLDITLINSRILLEKHLATKMTASRYRERLIDQLLDPYLLANNIHRRVAGQGHPNRVFQPDLGRLGGNQHFIEKAPTKLACKCCTRNAQSPRVMTSWRCKTCPDKPALCLELCFERYHTLVDFRHVRQPVARGIEP